MAVAVRVGAEVLRSDLAYKRSVSRGRSACSLLKCCWLVGMDWSERYGTARGSQRRAEPTSWPALWPSVTTSQYSMAPTARPARNRLIKLSFGFGICPFHQAGVHYRHRVELSNS